MPRESLTNFKRRQYGRYEGEPDEAQLSRYFHLDDTDRVIVENCRGDYNRLGFALQLTTVRFLGTFLSDPTQVPCNVLQFIATQLAILDLDNLSDYMNRRATRLAHRSEIQSHYGYHNFNTPPWRFRLSRFLYSRAWINNERPSLMFDMGTAWLIQNKVLLPGATTLQRLIIEIRERASNQLWRRLASLPTQEQKKALEELLVVPQDQRISQFDRFRKGPVNISEPSFVEAVERYNDLRAYGLQNLDFSGIPTARFKIIARQAGIISQWQISRMSDEKKIGILVAFVKAFEIIALDDALDVLDLLITDITGQAKRIGKKKRLRTLKDLDRSALTLAQVCALVLNEEMSDDQLREAIYACVPKDQLKQFIATVNEIARPPEGHFHEEMVEQYGRVKLFLSTLLNNICFECAPAGTITMASLVYLTELVPTRKQILDDAPLEIISRSWQRLVFDQEQRVTTRGYSRQVAGQLAPP